MSKKKENKDDLTELELAFLGYWFKNGFNGTDAYMLAKPNAKYDTARDAASKLLAKPHIQREVIKRKQHLRERENIDFGQLVRSLTNLLYETTEDGDRNHRLKAIDLLNKMGGFYQQKLDVTSQGDKIQINFNLGDNEQSETD